MTALQILFVLSIIAYKPMQLEDYHYPDWAMVVGWLVTCSSIIPIPIYFLWRFLTSKGNMKEVSLTVLSTRPVSRHVLKKSI